MQTKQALRRLPKLRYLLRKHTCRSELTYEPRNYERAVLTSPKANSTTQAFGDSAEIVSRDKESELKSSLKPSCNGH